MQCVLLFIFPLYMLRRYKSVQFEISTTEDPAVFQCTAKVLTVSETHLLKLQVGGLSVVVCLL